MRQLINFSTPYSPEPPAAGSGFCRALLVGLCSVLLAFPEAAQEPGPDVVSPGTVLYHQKISETEGGFTGTLGGPNLFLARGFRQVTVIGDLDDDGVVDLAVGADGDDEGAGEDLGTVWVLFLNADGTVRAHQKINSSEGGFAGPIECGDFFGSSLAALGDLDGDGVEDLIVGAIGDDDGGGFDCNPEGPEPGYGAVWVLFLHSDGTVKGQQKISSTQGGFGGTLEEGDAFGCAVTCLGDLDGDGLTEIAVGARGSEGISEILVGAVHILSLRADGTVAWEQEISETQGGFTGELAKADSFGFALAGLGDVDGDGVGDLAVGTPLDDDGGDPPGPSSELSEDYGAVWVLFLNPDGTTKAHQKISLLEGGLGSVLSNVDDFFGHSLAAAGDLDGDGTPDLVVGAPGVDDGGPNYGALFVLFMNADSTVKAHQKISATAGGFAGVLDNNDGLGHSTAWLGDLDGDGRGDLAAATPRDDDGGTDNGAIWILFLDGEIQAKATFRNAGTNPASYVVTAPPVLGKSFSATVDHASSGHAAAALAGFCGPLNLPLTQGVLLVDVSTLESLGCPVSSGTPATFDVPVPADPNLAGLQIYTQAAHIGGVSPFVLANAQDVVLGY